MSASFNRVTLLGNLTRNPEVKTLPSGTKVAEIGLAVNESFTAKNGEKREEVVFVDVSVFGQPASYVAQYGSKGSAVFVEGKLKLDRWDDKQSGQKRSKLKVQALSVQLIGGGQKASSTAPAAKAGKPRVQAPATRDQRDPDLDAEPEDVPF